VSNVNTAQRTVAAGAEGRGLRLALARLQEAGVTPAAAPLLERGVAAIGPSLRDAIVDEIGEFSATANPEILPELERHAALHVRELVRLVGGGEPGSFEFVRTHARRRAEQRFPVEAVLHAYRCGHRVLSPWLRDAATAAAANTERTVAAIADFSIEYTNLISALCAAEYVAHVRALAEAEGDQRSELLGILVSGYDEADGRVARLLKRAGYLEQRQSYCVVVAQSTDPLEMENPARTQRIVDAVVASVTDKSIRVLIGTRSNVVTAVFSATRRMSGWTAPQAALAGRLHAALLLMGPAVLVGISADHPSTSFIPRALREAMLALDFATVAERVVLYSNVPIRRLLLHRAADYVQPALPAWAHELAGADAKSAGDLVKTLRALADADMNVQRAARALDVHANTLYARIKRIGEITGLDGQRFHDLCELLLVVDSMTAAARQQDG
jgi:hypothetical protein